MTLAVIAIIAGLILLVWSSDLFVDGAIGLAENFGMSKAMIGLTIVALGTSAPEILVSLVSALSGAPSLALGNAVGSNIANVALVLGVTSLIASLPVHRGLIRQDLPALLAVTFLTGYLLSDGILSSVDGLIMIFALIVLMVLMVKYKKEHSQESIDPGTAAALPDISATRSVLLFAVGLAILVGSSRVLVWGAVEVARALEVSELVIGLTIVAIGTSLPELAASVASALKKHHDIALGNIVGSNILNLLAVLPAAAGISPIIVEPETLWRDYGAMSLVTLLLAAFILTPRKKRALSGFEGTILVAFYIGYMYLLYHQTLS